jgi:hypothetical protein
MLEFHAKLAVEPRHLPDQFKNENLFLDVLRSVTMIRMLKISFIIAFAPSQAYANNWTSSMDNKRKCETAAYEAEKAGNAAVATAYRECAKWFAAAAEDFRQNDQSYDGKTKFQRALDAANRGNMR